jgi:hypothetical protein
VAIEQAVDAGLLVLVKATNGQVNRLGGYPECSLQSFVNKDS